MIILSNLFSLDGNIVFNQHCVVEQRGIVDSKHLHFVLF